MKILNNKLNIFKVDEELSKYKPKRPNLMKGVVESTRNSSNQKKTLSNSKTESTSIQSNDIKINLELLKILKSINIIEYIESNFPIFKELSQEDKIIYMDKIGVHIRISIVILIICDLSGTDYKKTNSIQEYVKIIFEESSQSETELGKHKIIYNILKNCLKKSTISNAKMLLLKILDNEKNLLSELQNLKINTIEINKFIKIMCNSPKKYKKLKGGEDNNKQNKKLLASTLMSSIKIPTHLNNDDLIKKYYDFITHKIDKFSKSELIKLVDYLKESKDTDTFIISSDNIPYILIKIYLFREKHKIQKDDNIDDYTDIFENIPYHLKNSQNNALSFCVFNSTDKNISVDIKKRKDNKYFVKIQINYLLDNYDKITTDSD